MDHKRLVTFLAISVIILIILLALGMVGKCLNNSCVLWNGFFVGALSSLAATALAHLVGRVSWKKRYGKAEGQYEGKVFKKDTWELAEEPVSKAEIEYKQDNVLSIKLTSLIEKNVDTKEYLVWIGEMTMESENFGTVVWRYTNLPKPQHQFGFKRCIVQEEPDAAYVYLIGEAVEGYGKEVLIRT
jgi:hypothetical protein